MQTDADWDFLQDTALMHRRMWHDGDMKMAAEIRLRVGQFGATPGDRGRLRVEFSESKSTVTLQVDQGERGVGQARRARIVGGSPNVASLEERQARLVQQEFDDRSYVRGRFRDTLPGSVHSSDFAILSMKDLEAMSRPE